MSNDDHWIVTRVSEAQKHQTLVTEAVLARVRDLLKGELSDGQLTSAGLTSVASELIADMVPAPPGAGAKQ